MSDDVCTADHTGRLKELSRKLSVEDAVNGRSETESYGSYM